ncbi:MAG: cation transporter [Gammaproteobacteria bacterium]|nr:cation transporter [Gammaproteobacteria bacterium]
MHDHGRSHSPSAAFGRRRFILAIGLNLGFATTEFFFGAFADSAALIADALHNLADVFGLMIAWGGAWFARRPASSRFTYGLRSTTIYAAFINASVLLLACGGLVWEALQRFAIPAPAHGGIMLLVAAVGIVINGVSAALFWSDQAHDLNSRGAFVHLLSDAAVSLGVCLTGFAIMRSGLTILDPIVTLIIVGVILITTWQLLRDSTLLGLHGVPANIDLARVNAHLCELDGVAAVHDLHVWALSTTEAALTAHLVMPDGHPGDERLATLAHDVLRMFGIRHSTFQVELQDLAHACALEAGTPHSH